MSVAVQQAKRTKMPKTTNNPKTAVPLSNSDFATIAANVVKWEREQSKAYRQMPLAYVECLLAAMAEAGGVNLGHISEELCHLLPPLKPHDAETLVNIYMSTPGERPSLA
ncbi:hypothetical protein [Novosphingobium sp. MMS21-SN21R]|uniref:hypothetical protein n=1 Tax=Novosphingobium sp. MMS21-SN21R TaxID=2969298 RepID=UPI002887141C|nr:hypothetical protein [Novosphingobium sp. MMS21-SN21R]MDT0507449.1 hypothetical protein [Novosphingobium sp. MMS21-SN21R]